MTAYKECRRRELCAKIMYWPEKSAGISVWKLRDIKTKCRFVRIEDEMCILHDRKLEEPINEILEESWSYPEMSGGHGYNSENVLVKTWKRATNLV